MIKNIVNKLIKKKNPKADTTELNELYTIPKKEARKEMASFQTFKEGVFCQADLLFLPSNYGYKYCLGIVDNHTKKCDYEPLKSKESVAVVKAFKKIFARGIVKVPKSITFDDGSEFKSTCKEYFESLNVKVKVAPVGRHRMLGLIERKNQIVGTILHQIMAQEEITSNKINRHWVKLLPDVVEEINNSLPKPRTEAKSQDPILTDGNRDLIVVGTRVRLKLDNPIDTQGNKLHGSFRSSDIRWTRKIYTINQIVLKPGQPPYYLVDGITSHAFTKPQLLIV
jgi:hypothetical protein